MKKKIILIISAILILALAIFIFLYLTKDKEITLKSELKDLNIGTTGKIETNQKSYELMFKSSNEEIAIVDEDGNITAIAPGDVRIMIISKDGKTSITVPIKIIRDESWTINYDELSKVTCTEQTYKLSEDQYFEYQVSNSCYANNVYIVYANGEKLSVKQAIDKKTVTITALTDKGYKVQSISKRNNWYINYDELKTIGCTQTLATVYEDNRYIYEVPNSCYIDNVYIVYKNNEKYSIRKALKSEMVTIADLEAKGYKIYKTEKSVTWYLDYEELKNIACTQALATLYEDTTYTYQVPNSCYLDKVYIVFSNGEKYTVYDAFKSGKVKAAELENKGYKIYKTAKKVSWALNYDALKDVACTQALATIDEDATYVYQVPNSCYLDKVYVVYSNGEKYTVYDAFKNRKVKITELENKGYKIYKTAKKVTWSLDYDDYNNAGCTQAEVTIYEDTNYTYQVPNGCYSLVYVVYSNGERHTVSDALTKKRVTPDELIAKGYKITKIAKKVTWSLNYNELSNSACTEAVINLHEDNNYTYQVPSSCYLDKVYVVFSNGEKYTVKDAFKKGKVTIAELESKGYKIYKNSKTSWTLNYDELGKVSCTGTLHTIYKDNNYSYQVPNSCYAAHVYVVFSNGKRYTVQDALINKSVTIAQLEAKGYRIYKN